MAEGPDRSAGRKVPEAGAWRRAAARPFAGLAETLLLLWRARWWMLAAFLPLAAAGTYLASRMPVRHVAEARLVMPGASPATEAEILMSPAVAARVVERFGLARLYPDVARKVQAVQADAREAAAFLGVAALRRDLEARPVTGTDLLQVRFTHRDAGLAGEVLNALTGAYLNYRFDVPAIDPAPDGGAGEAALRARLAALSGEISAIEGEAGVADPGAEAAALGVQAARLVAAGFDAATRLSEAERRIAALRAGLAATEEELAGTPDAGPARRLAGLEQERARLVLTYLESSRPVTAIDAEIARAREDAARADADVRGSPNPVHQRLSAELMTALAEARALRGQAGALAAEAAAVAGRRALMETLAGRRDGLVRERAAAEAGLAALAGADGAAETSRDVRVLEPAGPPRLVTGPRRQALGLALAGAALAALMTGLCRVLLHGLMATPRSVERTVRVPVLAAVRRLA